MNTRKEIKDRILELKLQRASSKAEIQHLQQLLDKIDEENRD